MTVSKRKIKARCCKLKPRFQVPCTCIRTRESFSTVVVRGNVRKESERWILRLLSRFFCNKRGVCAVSEAIHQRVIAHDSFVFQHCRALACTPLRHAYACVSCIHLFRLQAISCRPVAEPRAHSCTRLVNNCSLRQCGALDCLVNVLSLQCELTPMREDPLTHQWHPIPYP